HVLVPPGRPHGVGLARQGEERDGDAVLTGCGGRALPGGLQEGQRVRLVDVVVDDADQSAVDEFDRALAQVLGLRRRRRLRGRGRDRQGGARRDRGRRGAGAARAGGEDKAQQGQERPGEGYLRRERPHASTAGAAGPGSHASLRTAAGGGGSWTAKYT